MADDALRELLSPQSHKGKGYVWQLCVVDGSEEETLAQIAALLAERLVNYLCRHRPDGTQLWADRRAGVRALDDKDRQRLVVFLEPHLGRPNGAEAEHDERAEGAISEFLWYELISHRPEVGRKIVRIEGPGFAVTDPGGDGLVVYRSDAGLLAFRLWEIKKHNGKGAVTQTVGNAHRQLNTRALSYLARYTAVSEQLSNDPDLQTFYATLVDKWQNEDAAVGAGVAVATSCNGDEADCFGGLPNRFPHLKNGDRLEGMLNAIGDYSAFVKKVKDEVWSGL
ncbi:MAG: hypothetical protein M3O70_13315 [Actinomycetota bacterium]|nr:hypothetical protein [Actinomycetota bacterium]